MLTSFCFHRLFVQGDGGEPISLSLRKKRWSTRRSCLVKSCGPEMSGGNGVWEGSDGT